MAGYAGISGSISSEWVAGIAPEYLSVEQEIKIKDLYSQLQRAANSGTSSIQKNSRKT